MGSGCTSSSTRCSNSHASRPAARAAYRATDLPTLTADLASAFRSAVERAGLELVVQCPSEAEEAWVDPEMWERIVLNLLSNAFKFTFHGWIGVQLELLDEEWRLTVRDSGIGIEAADLPKIFDRFHRVEGARGRSYEGSGIGLALVRELVRLHDGTMEAQSVPGSGTTFVVTIPRGTGRPAEDAAAGRDEGRPVLSWSRQETAAQTARAYVEEALRWLPDPDGPPVHETALHAALAPSRSVAPPRILLADDNADLRDYVRRLLEPQYEVECVADGEAALESIQRRPPDLVLSDVMMPRRDGAGLVRALRADPRTSAIPVILLSARAGEESRVEGLALGADDYLVKPFSAPELLARVGARIVEAARHGAESRVRDVLDTISDAFQALDEEGRLTYANPAMRRLWELEGLPADAIGKQLYDAFPRYRGTPLAAGYERARAERVPVEIEWYDESHRLWFLVRCFPSSDGGVLLFSQDITARKQAEEKVREGERRKDEFLATLAHEMRNPLAPIRNAITVLNARPASDPEEQWARDVVERQVGHMARLLDDLLDVSRIATSRLELRREPFTLAHVVQRSLEASTPLIEDAGVALTVSLPEDDVWLEADPLRISQVLSNLLNNAAKYTPRGGRILLTGRVEGGEVLLRVRDTGIGIDRDLLPRVFEIFVQGRPALSQSDGLGIGLSLVRGIVEAHGGRVVATSTGPGRGSEFVVTLPVARAPEPGPPLEVIGSASTEDDADRQGPAPMMKIVIADDNADSAESLARVLRLAGHDVRVVGDGERAVELARRVKPDVVVLDIGMPRLNGYGAARRIRAEVWGRRMVLVALTGWGQKQDRERAIEAGFDLHLVKPVDARVLDALLRRACSEERVV